MRRSFFTSLLLLLYLTSATEFSQLLKLPVLIMHFGEHKQLDEKLSLTGFLYMHYTHHDLNDNDQERDMQLPFKSLSPVSLNFQLIPTHLDIVAFIPVTETTRTLTMYQGSGLQSTFLSSIWQPPKNC